MDWDSLILTSTHKADNIHLDPVETIWMKDVLVCGLQEVVATATSEGPSWWSVAESGGARQCAPTDDTMPSPRWTAAGGFPSTNAEDFESTTRVKNSMHDARGRNRIIKIPDAADEIAVLHVVELQIGSWLHQRQITHLPHPPMCKEATRSSLQPHCHRHLAAKHLLCLAKLRNIHYTTTLK